MKSSVQRAADEFEEREVRVDDPHLSAATNERLTEELRAVIGASRVRVPASRPHVSTGASEGEVTQGSRVVLGPIVMANACAGLVLAGIIGLTGSSWWLLPIVMVALFLTVGLIVLVTLRLTTITEHPAPDLAAALSEAGAKSPDNRFSTMVAEFRGEPERGVSELRSDRYGERDVAANLDPSRAGVQQNSAWTPAGQPAAPTRSWSPVDGVLAGAAIVLALFSIAIPAAFGGGAMWILTAVVVPVAAIAVTALGRAAPP